MEDRIENLVSFCSAVDFGTVNLSDEESEFCREMNDEVISFCRSLPESTQTDALLFFVRYFRIPFGQELSFFMNYYVPAWSIVYWLIQSATEGEGLSQEDRQNAKTAHSMALLLHPLDDHLNDGHLSATHLALLLRSQLWLIMNNAFNRLAHGINGGEETLQSFIGDYYASISGSEEVQSLDRYCDLFRKQMATWLIAPVLMTKKMSIDEGFTDAIQTAYESFGIAWRLLDDINDIQTDMMKGIHSSIYTCLPEKIRNYWDKDTEKKKGKNSSDVKIVLNYILENSVIDKVRERIRSELEFAQSIADDYNMAGWADELRCLLSPLRSSQGPS
jgi:hypothetical protein